MWCVTEAEHVLCEWLFLPYPNHDGTTCKLWRDFHNVNDQVIYHICLYSSSKYVNLTFASLVRSDNVSDHFAWGKFHGVMTMAHQYLARDPTNIVSTRCLHIMIQEDDYILQRLIPDS